jgi:hypothetical protein
MQSSSPVSFTTEVRTMIGHGVVGGYLTMNAHGQVVRGSERCGFRNLGLEGERVPVPRMQGGETGQENDEYVDGDIDGSSEVVSEFVDEDENENIDGSESEEDSEDD